MSIFWMSFVNEKGFAGVVVTEAKDFYAAVQKTWDLGINPGGQIASWEYDETEPMEVKREHFDILLSKEQIKKEGY